MELFQAANQYAIRPADERFNSLEEMHVQTRAYANHAGVARAAWSDMRVEASGDNLVTVGRTGTPANLTHYAFGQLAARVGAPANYLRGLPPTLAAQNLNHGFKHEAPEGEAQLLMHVKDDGGYLLRAATTDRYERVWNYEVLDRLIPFTRRHGMIPAQATFDWAQRNPLRNDDGSEYELTTFDPNADKALYASDHDMFAFVMDPQKVIRDPVGQPMRRGFIVGNSEVGAGSLWFMSFLFRDVCCNHIIWGAQGVLEVRLRHVGSVRDRWSGAFAKVRRYLDGAASLEEAKLEELSVRIGDTKEEVLDTLFGIRSLGLSRKALSASYDAVKRDEDGDPRSVWGMAQGITRHAQDTTYQDARQTLDKAAGKLLEIAF